MDSKAPGITTSNYGPKKATEAETLQLVLHVQDATIKVTFLKRVPGALRDYGLLILVEYLGRFMKASAPAFWILMRQKSINLDT